MIVYVARVNDRHADPEPYVFTTPDAAIGFARSAALAYAHEAAYVEEGPPPEGWLYHATYSVEGDSVWVLAKALDAGDDE